MHQQKEGVQEQTSGLETLRPQASILQFLWSEASSSRPCPLPWGMPRGPEGAPLPPGKVKSHISEPGRPESFVNVWQRKYSLNRIFPDYWSKLDYWKLLLSISSLVTEVKVSSFFLTPIGLCIHFMNKKIKHIFIILSIISLIFDHLCIIFPNLFIKSHLLLKISNIALLYKGSDKFMVRQIHSGSDCSAF